MDPELRELLELALRAQGNGKDADTINLAIREETDGKYADLASLQKAVESTKVLREARPSLASDLGRMFAQGATFGFGDEIAGATGGDADVSRGRVERIREEHPWLSFGAEVAGGIAAPAVAALVAPQAVAGLTGLTAGRAVLNATGSRILAGAAGGAAGGLSGGLLTGAGEAQPGLVNRVEGAAMGGLLGLPLGAGVGAAGGAASRFIDETRGAGSIARARLGSALDAIGTTIEQVPGKVKALGEGSVVADLGENLGRLARAALNDAPNLAAPGGPKAAIRARNADTGERLVSEIRKASGLTDTFANSLDAAKKHVQEVREAFFHPLEEQYKQVTGARVQAALRDPRIAAAMRRVAPEVAEGKRPPSFTELQDAMLTLRDNASAARVAGRPNASQRASEAHDMMRAAMEADIPGFGEAQSAFRSASQRVTAHETGAKMALKPVREIRDALAALPDDEARNAFRQGMLDHFENSLLQRRGGGAMAGRIMDAGRGMQERLRLLSESDPAFKSLLSGVGKNDRWRNTWRQLSGNSSTAEQASDSFTLSQIPTEQRAILQRLLLWVEGSEQQRRAAANILGQVLLSDGENAARKLAREMALNASRSAKVGAVVGTSVARETASPGGLFGASPTQ